MGKVPLHLSHQGEVHFSFLMEGTFTTQVRGLNMDS